MKAHEIVKVMENREYFIMHIRSLIAVIPISYAMQKPNIIMMPFLFSCVPGTKRHGCQKLTRSCQLPDVIEVIGECKICNVSQIRNILQPKDQREEDSDLGSGRGRTCLVF